VRKYVDDESHGNKPGPDCQLCEVWYTKFIRSNGSVLALNPIRGINSVILADRGPALATLYDTLETERTHQSLDGAAGDGNLLATELPEDLTRVVDPEFSS
jgi:hypothetical protein